MRQYPGFAGRHGCLVLKETLFFGGTESYARRSRDYKRSHVGYTAKAPVASKQITNKHIFPKQFTASGGFICLALSPFICRSFVSLVFRMPGTAERTDPFICLLLVDAWHSCLLAWQLSARTGSFVSLCLPSFVSRCLPAWMSSTAWVDDSFVSPLLSPPLSPRLPGTARFICLPLSPFWCSLGGRIHLSPVVSQPTCLTGSFVSLCLPSFVSRCLPAWMSGTAFRAAGFICLPLPSFASFLARLSGLTDSLDKGSTSVHRPCQASRLRNNKRQMKGDTGGIQAARQRKTNEPVNPKSRARPPSLDTWHGSLGGQAHVSPILHTCVPVVYICVSHVHAHVCFNCTCLCSV